MTPTCGRTHRIRSALVQEILAVIKAEPKLTVQQVADRCHISAASVYYARVAGGLSVPRRRQTYLTSDLDVDNGIPKCRCGLRLLSDEERAQGHCNGCTPTSAVGYMGRRDEPVCMPLRW